MILISEESGIPTLTAEPSPTTSPTPSVSPTAVPETTVSTTVDNSQDIQVLLTQTNQKLDMIAGLHLFPIGVCAAILVSFILYKVIDNFVSY
jgi:hypothetical protein